MAATDDSVGEMAPGPGSSIRGYGRAEIDAYFASMAAMQDAISKRNYELAASKARENVRHIAGFIRSSKLEYASMGIANSIPPSIPGLQQGGTMLALVGDRHGLAEMAALVESIPELADRRTDVVAHAEDLALFEAIMQAVRENPGCLQTSVKNLVHADDGRRVSTLISWLEKAGRIRRRKSGSTYALLSSDSPDAPVDLPRRVTLSHRSDSDTIDVHELDLSNVPYVPLPRAPLRWEERQGGRVPDAVIAATEPFEIRDGDGWTLRFVEKVPMTERPDTAFRRFYSVDDGLILLDDLGNAAAFPDAPASAMKFGRDGVLQASKPLLHDTYRVSANALGHGIVGLSKECVLHAYDSLLNPCFETSLRGTPEVVDLTRRVGISNDALKNHIRTVSLSHDNARYLVTGVDEAWCIGSNGQGLWGVRFPMPEGWTRVVEPAGSVGTSNEIDEALALMDLAFPLSADDLKRRYRELAKMWHPDLNPNERAAEAQMKALNSAAEILTGVDQDALAEYTGAYYQKIVAHSEMSVDDLEVSFSVSLVMGEGQAADWIYAAAFARQSYQVFLASYSGRVVQIDESGSPVRVYDIGTVPKAIVDTGDYLYFLTDTRLYVLRDDVLHSVVDTFEGGELIMAHTGFALLEKKRLRWFAEDGRYVGSVVSNEPIRRVFHTGSELVVETRMRRAVIHGAPAWWD